MGRALKRKSIRTKILAIVLVSILIISASLGYLSFVFSKNRLVHMLGESSKAVAVTAAALINPDDLALIASNADGIREKGFATSAPAYSATYEQTKEPGIAANSALNAALEKFSRYTKLLSRVKRDNMIKGPINAYIVDRKDMINILTSERAMMIGSRYSMVPAAKTAAASGSPQSTGIYRDKDGAWISAYAPISAGGIKAVIEVGNNISLYIGRLNNELGAIIFLCLIGFLGTALLSYKLVDRLVDKIRQLDMVAANLEMENYSIPVDIRTEDEIGHLARTFEKMRLSIKSKIGELKLALVKEKKAHIESIMALTNAIGLRDPYTREHLYRVDKYALLIARAVKLPKNEIARLRYGCYLHDIGKIYIEDDVFRKVLLSRGELENVRAHAAKGAEIINGIPFFENVKDIILYHQERYDGTGYPEKLKGTEIPLLARIIAVADAFDAMTTDRPYKPKIGFQEAMDVIEKNAGTQFDPQIAKSFLRYRSSIEKIAKKHF